jgi:hypothetical protein
MRQVRTRHHEVPWAELSYEVTDEVPPAGRDDMMYLAFRVKMPTDGAKGIAMVPRLEGFATPDLDNLKVRCHIGLLHEHRRVLSDALRLPHGADFPHPGGTYRIFGPGLAGYYVFDIRMMKF